MIVSFSPVLPNTRLGISPGAATAAVADSRERPVNAEAERKVLRCIRSSWLRFFSCPSRILRYRVPVDNLLGFPNNRKALERSKTMRRRSFLGLGGMAALGQIDQAHAAPLAFQDEKSKLKITGVRLVHTRPKRPVPAYKPAPGSWSTGGVEVANPMSIYPEYKAERSLFMPDPGKLEAFTVEISTDKGVKGYGCGGIAGGEIVKGHFTKLLIGEDPF